MAFMQRPDQDKNSINFMRGQVQTARADLLAMIIFTVLNLVLLLVDGNTYLLFSISSSYYLAVLGMILDDWVVGTYTITALVIGTVILAVYLFCWIRSKKKHVWLTVAFALTVVDAVFLVGFTVLFLEDFSVTLMDMIFKLLLLWLLFRGVRNAKRLRKCEAELEETTATANPELP